MPESRGVPSVLSTTSALKSDSGPLPATASVSAGSPGSCASRATMPPAPSSTSRSSDSWRVSFAKAPVSETWPEGVPIRFTLRSTLPSPPESESAPSRSKLTSSPRSGAPSTTFAAVSLPIFTETGSSGRAKGVTSGAASSAPGGVVGRRGRSISSAESSPISIRPVSSAARRHCIAPLRIVSQAPWSSEMVRLSKVARDDSAPLNPSSRTVRPAPERLSSMSPVSQERSRLSSSCVAAAGGAAVSCASAGRGSSSSAMSASFRIRMPARSQDRVARHRRWSR